MTAGCIAIALGMQPVAQARTPPPGKPIRVIVPVGTGGGLDTIARIVSPKLSAGLGQTIVIDNRPGAGGAIGVELAARAAPDGCTLLMASASYLVQALMYKDKVSYDPLRDFAPISQVAAAPYVLIVTPALAARSVH